MQSRSSSRTGRPQTSRRPPRCPASRLAPPTSPSGSPPTPSACSSNAAPCLPPTSAGLRTRSSPGPGAYWTCRIAYDTLVHRWDAEAGAGIAGPSMEPETAADAVDEVLDVGLRVTRAVANAPAGPAIRLACADVDQAWHLDLADVGRLTIRREPIDVAVALRGTAEALLLWLWGRIDIRGGEIDVDGDRSVVERWTELLPTS